MKPKVDVAVSLRERVRGAGLRVKGEVTPAAVGVLWGRLLLRCEAVPAAGPAFGLLYGQGAYEACWAIPPGYPVPERLRETEAPGGWYASALHEGAYDRIEETARRILDEWLPHGGFRPREGPIVERYLNDPREVAEVELRTEVCVPVHPDPVGEASRRPLRVNFDRHLKLEFRGATIISDARLLAFPSRC